MPKPARCCDGLIPANAAQSWNFPAAILKKPQVMALIQSSAGQRALEVGPGCLRNSLFLLKQGLEVDTFDLPGAVERFPNRYQQLRTLGGRPIANLPCRPTYSIIVTTYVIETICDRESRDTLVERILKCLKPHGAWVLSVRGPRNIILAARKHTRCCDGYITVQRTFVRSYTRKGLTQYLHKVGFDNLSFLHKPWVKEPELLDVIVKRRGDAESPK
jgi:hypothetical protein